MSTVKVTNLQHASSASPNIVLDSSGNATMAGSMAMATPFAMRNKIINGAMEIDQRNAGAAVSAVGSYPADRWYYGSNSSRGTSQQNAGSVTPPAGFKNYIGFTSSSGTAIATGDYNGFAQLIEGLNTIDLAWGTASAKNVVLSFWVRSSLTGTFGGAFKNHDSTRSYPFSYTISTANTWEYKTVSVPGDTTGTWTTTNTKSVEVFFSLGTGATYSGTAGSWASANYVSSTGAVSPASTNGATFYLTGVQLEVGTVATPFERRLFPQELAMCQRYYETSFDLGTAPADGISGQAFIAQAWSASNASGTAFFKVTKRTTPSFAFYSGNNIVTPTNGRWQWLSGAWNDSTATNPGRQNNSNFQVTVGSSAAFTVTGAYSIGGGWVASSEL